MCLIWTFVILLIGKPAAGKIKSALLEFSGFLSAENGDNGENKDEELKVS